MSYPVPRTGLVLRYSFLWSEEAKVGQSEGSTDRPCAVVLAVETSGGEYEVAVVPITHSPPRGRQAHVALTSEESRLAGLDSEPHWVVVEETNGFFWPGFDLRLLPGTDHYDYGVLPKSALRRVIEALIKVQRGPDGVIQTRRD